MRYRSKVADLAENWIGKKESDGSFKTIIDIYNSYKGPFPRGIKMQYNWPWCACTWSALAIKLGYTDIIPIEISCPELIKLAKKMGIWVEKDNYVPMQGDAILYDWDDNGKGDNTGNPDHIGVVKYVNPESGYMVIVEGNYDDEVKLRTISINGRYIRGFITPKYTSNTIKEPEKIAGKTIETIARECIAGIWGNGNVRKKNLESNGYNYQKVQDTINKILNTPSKSVIEKAAKKEEIIASCKAQKFSGVLNGTYKTISDLKLRNDAGTNKKVLVTIPKGTKVNCYGYYNTYNKLNWLYVQVTINGVVYHGFCASSYLEMV